MIQEFFSSLMADYIQLLGCHGLVLILMAIFLSVVSYTDFREFRIYDKHLFLFLCLYTVVSVFVYGTVKWSLIGFAFGFGLFLLVGLITDTAMGGDIKIMGLLGLIVGPNILFALIVLMIGVSVLISIYFRIRKGNANKKFPLAPVILISFIVLNCILLNLC